MDRASSLSSGSLPLGHLHKRWDRFPDRHAQVSGFGVQKDVLIHRQRKKIRTSQMSNVKQNPDMTWHEPWNPDWFIDGIIPIYKTARNLISHFGPWNKSLNLKLYVYYTKYVIPKKFKG